MAKKRKPKRDDEATSQRFIDMTREIGADVGDDREFEYLFNKVAPKR